MRTSRAPRRRSCEPPSARRLPLARRRRKRRKARPGGEHSRRPVAESPRRSQSAERDAAARAALVPLAEGERPLAITIGALLALALGLINLVAYLAGLEIRGDRPALSGIVIFTGLMLTAAWGMWRMRYWAVLGMEALLALIILIFSLLALRFEDLSDVAIAVAVIAPAGALFWFLVKAMARIQMPARPGADPDSG